MEMNVEDENVEVLEDISMLDKYMQDTEEHFIIGGATIYKLLMPKANKIYLTLIHEKFDGDVYFPEISDEEWKIVDRTAGITDEKIHIITSLLHMLENNTWQIYKKYIMDIMLSRVDERFGFTTPQQPIKK